MLSSNVRLTSLKSLVGALSYITLKVVQYSSGKMISNWVSVGYSSDQQSKFDVEAAVLLERLEHDLGAALVFLGPVVFRELHQAILPYR